MMLGIILVINPKNTSSKIAVYKDSKICFLKTIKYTDEQKELIIRTYLERGSLRGMRRLFGVAPATLTSWIKKSQHPDQDHAASSTNG